MSLVARLVLVAGRADGGPLHLRVAANRARQVAADRRRPHSRRPVDGLGIGFVANFFDTLGIGSFASTTAWIKFRNLVPDELIRAL